MTLTTTSRSNYAPTYLKPTHFSDYLSSQQAYCLFLDVDGTLAAFTLDPKDSFIPSSTLTLLQAIQSHGVLIAVVTGRSLIEAQQMLSPMRLPIAATHGLEIAFTSSLDETTAPNTVISINTDELLAIKKLIVESCLPFDELTVEDKPYSIALHYRQNPHLGDAAYSIMAKAIKSYPEWQLKQGKYVWEIVPKGADKGAAILTLLQQMQTCDNLCPIFIGDDITDEAGFSVVQSIAVLGDSYLSDKRHSVIKGMGIKVGHEPTCANYYINDINEVNNLLDNFLDFCQQQITLSTTLADTHNYLDGSTDRFIDEKIVGPII